jgi:hypothetical protein
MVRTIDLVAQPRDTEVELTFVFDELVCIVIVIMLLVEGRSIVSICLLLLLCCCRKRSPAVADTAGTPGPGSALLPPK